MLGGVFATRSASSSRPLARFRGTTGAADCGRPTSSGHKYRTYWDFGGVSFEDLSSRAVINNTRVIRAYTPATTATKAAPAVGGKESNERWPRPESPLHGVDFSGGEEDQYRGNRKIWVATWAPGTDVVLRCGVSDNGAGKICRRDLPTLIRQELGWWSLDFPFGIAKETARALGLRNWSEWLKWCAREGTATTLRDCARDQVKKAGVPWGKRRQVDDDNQTTWFPLFEQLYRQTIYGAREVLLPLDGGGACISPWGCNGLKDSTVVVEGFPGATIRDHLLKRRVSYKGTTSAHRNSRQAILGALKSAPFAIPISDEVGATAVEDQEGDAIDALALILGAWISQRLPTDTWKQRLANLDACAAAVECWFPA